MKKVNSWSLYCTEKRQKWDHSNPQVPGKQWIYAPKINHLPFGRIFTITHEIQSSISHFGRISPKMAEIKKINFIISWLDFLFQISFLF